MSQRVEWTSYTSLQYEPTGAEIGEHVVTTSALSVASDGCIMVISGTDESLRKMLTDALASIPAGSSPRVTAKVEDDRVGTISINGWEVVAHQSTTDPGYLNVEIAGDNLDDDDPTAAQLKVHINEHLIYMGNTQAGPDHVCVRCGTNTSDPDVLEDADERCMATVNGVGEHDLAPLPFDRTDV